MTGAKIFAIGSKFAVARLSLLVWYSTWLPVRSVWPETVSHRPSSASLEHRGTRPAPGSRQPLDGIVPQGRWELGRIV